MYRVIKMRGDSEPWWFLEGWQEDIEDCQEFEDFFDALVYYRHLLTEMMDQYERYQSKDNFLAAFWQQDDVRWCDACGEDLQQYHGIALLEDWGMIKTHRHRRPYQRKNSPSPQKMCRNTLSK